MRNRVCGDEYRRTVLCVDSYENSVPEGKFYSTCFKHATPFYGTVQLVTRIEDMLNEMDYPRSFTAVRSFTEPPEQRAESPPAEGPPDGKLATFMIRIMLRQNASWQGSVTWLEGNRSQSFRSVLELILLMDSALRSERREEEASSA